MINEEEKFDNLLRKKLSERDFFFDEENWLKASEQIDRDEKKKKRRRFAIIFISGLTLGIAITAPVMSLLMNNQANKALTALNTQGSTTTAVQSNTNPVTAESNQDKSVLTVTTIPQSPVTASTQPAAINNSTADKQNNNTSKEVPIASATNPAIVNSLPADNKPTHKKSATALLANNIPVRSAKHTRGISGTTEIVNNTTVNSPVRHHKNNKSLNNAVATTPDNTPLTVANSTAPEETITTTSSQQSVTQNQASETTITKNLSDSSNQTIATASQPKPDSASFTKMAVKDSNSVTQGMTNEPTYVKEKLPTLLSIDAGGGYSLGWTSGGNKEANGLSPIFGISATHFFSKKVAISLGAQYNSLTNLKTGYTNINTTYDFGANATSTNVTPNTIHYVAVPLTLQYYINDDNAVCFGTSLLYLVNTSSTVTSTTQTDLNPSVSHSKTAMGYTDGFNKIDLQARVAYRRRIYKRFSAGIEGYFGLLDIEDNSFFSDNTFQRNSGFRLILSFDLIK